MNTVTAFLLGAAVPLLLLLGGLAWVAIQIHSIAEVDCPMEPVETAEPSTVRPAA